MSCIASPAPARASGVDVLLVHQLEAQVRQACRPTLAPFR